MNKVIRIVTTYLHISLQLTKCIDIILLLLNMFTYFITLSSQEFQIQSLTVNFEALVTTKQWNINPMLFMDCLATLNSSKIKYQSRLQINIDIFKDIPVTGEIKVSLSSNCDVSCFRWRIASSRLFKCTNSEDFFHVGLITFLTKIIFILICPITFPGSHSISVYFEFGNRFL